MSSIFLKYEKILSKHHNKNFNKNSSLKNLYRSIHLWTSAENLPILHNNMKMKYITVI